MLNRPLIWASLVALVLLCNPCLVWGQQATTGQSAAHLATPVQLPYEKVLPGDISDYEILKFNGIGGQEYTMQTEPLPATGFKYVQKQGRSCTGLKPYWMLRNTKTNQGIAVALAWSGNWLVDIEPQAGGVLLHVATSPSQLAVFDTFNGLPIPGALVSEFTGDWDYGAQPIVHFVREKLRRDIGKDWPPVQYNTWYANRGVFDEKTLQTEASAAAQLGCELFTVDAGWYGGESGGDWNKGLGDWTENKQRFPSGMAAFAEQVRGMGMKFGLWIEIECASPASPVAKAHPDWFLRQGTRLVSNRAVLDFGKPEVLAWAKSVIDDLMSRYKLDYLKMDFNTDMYVDGEKVTDGKDPLYSHYQGWIALLKYIREKYPQLVVENCSSGSLREDMMPPALSDTHWVSDNIFNHFNLAVIFGATYMFPPEICSHWSVVVGPDNKTIDDETIFTTNMAGHLGMSGNIAQWSAKTRQIASERIALYKKLRPLICKADVFHLTPQTNPTTPQSAEASLYVDPDSGKALLFAFHAGDPALEKTLFLRGLTADRVYHLTMPAGFGADQTVSGKELIERGLTIKFPHAGASAIIQLDPSAS